MEYLIRIEWRDTEGYVLATDINDLGASSLEEAEEYNHAEARSIPLYDVEGKNVIGGFTIDADLPNEG